MLHRPVEALYKNTEGAKVLFDMCRAHMEEKLAKKPEIFHALVPDFPPGCRRITPGPGVSEQVRASTGLTRSSLSNSAICP